MVALTWSEGMVGHKGAVLSPYGKLYDGKGNEIAEKVFWCNTETGEVRCYPDIPAEDPDRPGYLVWYSGIRHPPLTFVPREDNPFPVLSPQDIITIRHFHFEYFRSAFGTEEPSHGGD